MKKNELAKEITESLKGLNALLRKAAKIGLKTDISVKGFIPSLKQIHIVMREYYEYPMEEE